jgi:hypothetical protein
MAEVAHGKIADRLMRVLRKEDLTEAIEALFDCTSFCLACVSCPDCRQKFATSIANQLLEVASRRAADLGNAVNPGDCGRH